MVLEDVIILQFNTRAITAGIKVIEYQAAFHKICIALAFALRQKTSVVMIVFLRLASVRKFAIDLFLLVLIAYV